MCTPAVPAAAAPLPKVEWPWVGEEEGVKAGGQWRLDPAVKGGGVAWRFLAVANINLASEDGAEGEPPLYILA